MAKFNITINGADRLAAVTSARETYNISRGDAPEIKTDEDYLQFVIDGAVASWDNQYADPIRKKDQIIAQRDAEIAGLKATLATK